jgi:hypothetical protein
MWEIVYTIGASTLMLYAVIAGAAWALRSSLTGPREWALRSRWLLGGLLFSLAVAAWVTSGIYTFIYLSVFWQGAYTGATAMLWLAYLPALLLVIRAGRRQAATARELH